MEYKFTKDNKKVAIVGQVNSTQSIVQDVYYLNGDDTKPALGGEPYIYNTSYLFDEPVKPAEYRWLQQDKKAWNEERYKLKQEVEKERNQINAELKRLRLISKYLRNVSKESQEEKVKEVAKMLSALYSTCKKWIVFSCEWSQPKIVEFNSIADDNVLNYFTEGFEGGLRLMSLNLDRHCSDVCIKLADYTDGSGSNKQFYIFDNEDDVHKCLQYWLDRKQEYTYADVKYAKEHDLTVDKEKVRQMYLKQLERAKKEYSQYSEYLQQREDSIKEAEDKLKEYK